MYTIQLQFKELGPALKPSFVIGYILITPSRLLLFRSSTLEGRISDFYDITVHAIIRSKSMIFKFILQIRAYLELLVISFIIIRFYL